MKSSRRGKRTSDVEVTNLSAHGFWILVRGRELFVSFEYFAFFKDDLYWPDLDVDLAIESIEKPEKFPLVSRSRRPRAKRVRATATSR